MGAPNSTSRSAENRSRQIATSSEHSDCLIIRLIGEASTGKSGLCHRVLKGPNVDGVSSYSCTPIRFDYTLNPDDEKQKQTLQMAFLDRRSGSERFKVSTSSWYSRMERDFDALLICFDVSCTELYAVVQMIDNAYSNTSKLNFLRPSFNSSMISLIGCKVDLNPSLLYDAWNDARNIVVAIKPDRDAGCAFAVLPEELLYRILFTFLELNLGEDRMEWRLDKKMEIWGDWSIDVPQDIRIYSENDNELSKTCHTMTRADLIALSNRYRAPVYLCSAKTGEGVDQLMHSVVTRLIDNYHYYGR